MDTKKDCKIPKCGDAAAQWGGKVVVGIKQLRKALNAGAARHVFLAEDADPAITQPVAELCGEQNIQTTWVPTMAELGRDCGIEVGAAAAAVVIR